MMVRGARLKRRTASDPERDEWFDIVREAVVRNHPWPHPEAAKPKTSHVLKRCWPDKKFSVTDFLWILKCTLEDYSDALFAPWQKRPLPSSEQEWRETLTQLYAAAIDASQEAIHAVYQRFDGRHRRQLDGLQRCKNGIKEYRVQVELRSGRHPTEAQAYAAAGVSLATGKRIKARLRRQQVL
jgi:hypothetical protein